MAKQTIIDTAGNEVVPVKSKTNRDRLKELYVHYNLNEEDIFRHKKFGYIMITRTGIEKIMSHDNVVVKYETEMVSLDGCMVKAIATKGETTIETYGSATKANCQSTYFLEMAQKRAKARCVLEITSFYSLGVYSDVEVDEWNVMHKTNQ